MVTLRYTLVTDGPSDRALLPIIDWLLKAYVTSPTITISQEWVPRTATGKHGDKLAGAITIALERYPCDLLFIHRDAEREDREKRIVEIDEALTQCFKSISAIPVVPVVPIRMTEAWFLFDEALPDIRHAADNPTGKVALPIPGTKRLEQLPDPKEILHDLLRKASELSPRRLRNFGESRRFQLLAERIQDFSPLRGVSAFDALESDVARIVRENGW